MTIDFCAVGILALGMGATADACTISAHGLRVEHRERPLGLDNAAPRLSWLLESAVRGAQQSAYQVIVADAGSGATIWDSGKVPGDASHLAPYAGPPLAADAWYSWRVRVWDEHDRVSDWSEPAECYTGLWSDQDWDGAQWIALETAPEGSRQTPGIHHPSDREALRARRRHERPTAVPQVGRREAGREARYAVRSGAGPPRGLPQRSPHR